MISFWDGKARAGYAFDSAMVYGVIGGAIGVYDRDGTEQLDTYSISYGVGVDTMVTDKIFIGVEFLYRDVVTGNSTLTPTDHWEYRMDSLQVRAGYKF
jgi:opacity protein-like surface antigen